MGGSEAGEEDGEVEGVRQLLGGHWHSFRYCSDSLSRLWPRLLEVMFINSQLTRHAQYCRPLTVWREE